MKLRPAFALSLALLGIASHARAEASFPDSLVFRSSSTLLQQLSSGDEAFARMAELRLACGGPRALDVLERAGFARRPEMRPRVLRILDVGLRATFTDADLRRHPSLDSLVRPAIEAAGRLADSLAALHAIGKWGTLDHGAGGSVDGDQRLVARGGFAVPAAIRLLRDPRPMGRLVGVFMIQRLRARTGRKALEPVRMDTSEVTSWEDDYEATHTLGELATAAAGDLAWNWGFFGPILCLIREGTASSEGFYSLMSGIRTARAALAGIAEDDKRDNTRDWDTWWAKAWPAWRDWWDLCRGAEAPADLAEWEAAVHSYDCYGFEATEDTSGTTTLEILGPPGFHAELSAAKWDGRTTSVLLSGAPPLRLQVSAEEGRRRGWKISSKPWAPVGDGKMMIREPEGDGMTHFRVTDPEGVVRTAEFDGLTAYRVRLTLRRPRRPDERLRLR